MPVEESPKRKTLGFFINRWMTSLDSSTAKDQSVIGVNTQHAPVRQNFTTAHELGHLLMHDQEQLHIDHAFRVRLRDDVSSQGTDDAEREANFFAASLLMPRTFLEADLEGEDYVRHAPTSTSFHRSGRP